MHRTLDDLAEELRPTVFRLLDAGKAGAAAELIETYAAEADTALWREVLAPAEAEAEAVPATPEQAEEAVVPTAVQPGKATEQEPAVPAVPVVRPGKQSGRGRSAAGARARAAVGR